MKKPVKGLVAAAVMASALAFAAPANAGSAAGFIGGLIVGGALTASQPPVYAPVPTYTAPVYQRCYWTKQKYHDPYAGWVWRRVQVCS